MNNFKFKWAIVGDLHIGVRNDSKVFHNLLESFIDKTIADMKQKGCNVLILLGDLFERRKFINFDTYKVCKEKVFNKLRDAGIRVFVIAGNHDVFYKNTNSINAIDLCITESEYPNVTAITQTAKEIMIDGQKVLFVPWVNKENHAEICDIIDNSLARYMIAHLDMVGFEMHKGAISDHGHFDADRLSKFEKVISGHYHTKSSKGNIYYLGTPYQTSWNDYGEEKGFHYLENGELIFIPNQEKMFHRFIYDDRDGVPVELIKSIKTTELTDKYVKLIIKSKRNAKMFDSFIELIEQKNPADLNILDESNFLVEPGEEMGEMKDTLSVIQYFIGSELETDLDKNRLMSGMAALYQSAIELTDGD